MSLTTPHEPHPPLSLSLQAGGTQTGKEAHDKNRNQASANSNNQASANSNSHEPRDEKISYSGQINEEYNTARISPVEVSLTELRHNPSLSYHVLLGLWRDLILDPSTRLVVLRDLAEVLRVYGPVEPMYSMESAARLIPCSSNALRVALQRHKDKLRTPHYALKKEKDYKWRKKLRYLYASDVLYLRECARFKRAGHGSVSRYFAERRARTAGRAAQ